MAERKLTVEAIARVCHEANRAYCVALGDFSQPAWADAPDWQRESAMQGVAFHLRQPHADPRASHENWLAVKVAEGWTYGAVKDPQAKTHPCMVPYDVLPLEQRLKDAVFCSIVDALRPVAAMEGGAA